MRLSSQWTLGKKSSNALQPQSLKSAAYDLCSDTVTANMFADAGFNAQETVVFLSSHLTAASVGWFHSLKL